MQDPANGLAESPFQKLSDKSLEGLVALVFGGTQGGEMTLLATFDHVREPKVDPIRNYQTVSPRTTVNRGPPRRGTLLDHTRPPSRATSTTRRMASTTSPGRSNWM